MNIFNSDLEIGEEFDDDILEFKVDSWDGCTWLTKDEVIELVERLNDLLGLDKNA